MAHNYREDEHDYPQAQQLADQTHGAHHTRCYPVVAPVNGTHNGIGIGRGEEGKSQAHEYQSSNDAL